MIRKYLYNLKCEDSANENTTYSEWLNQIKSSESFSHIDDLLENDKNIAQLGFIIIQIL